MKVSASSSTFKNNVGSPHCRMYQTDVPKTSGGRRTVKTNKWMRCQGPLCVRTPVAGRLQSVLCVILEHHPNFGAQRLLRRSAGATVILLNTVSVTFKSTPGLPTPILPHSHSQHLQDSNFFFTSGCSLASRHLHLSLARNIPCGRHKEQVQHALALVKP